MDKIQRTVFRVVSDVTGIEEKYLNETSKFSEILMDEDDFEDIYERCCSELGIPLPRIVSSMPMYRIRASEMIMSSLQNLAPFRQDAAKLLEKYSVRTEDETLASLAETMRREEYVPSGSYNESTHPPRSRKYSYLWCLFYLSLAIIIPFLIIRGRCNPLCFGQTLSTWGQMQEMLPWSIGIAILCIAYGFLPGLWELRRKKIKAGQRSS